MENEKRKVGDYTVLCAVNIGSREIILAENEQSTNGERFLCCYGERNDIFEKFTECAVGGDYIDATLFFAERIKQDAEKFRAEVEKLDIPVTVITQADCIPDHYKNDINGKIIAINPAILKPEYQRADRQLYYVTGGFGASANSRGSAVFCKNLYDGKNTRYERMDVLGEVKPECMPDWAEKKAILFRHTQSVYRTYQQNNYTGEVPTLQDFRAELLKQSEPEAQEIALAIELFTNGSLNTFAKKTNVDTDNRLICYDILDLGKQLMPIGMLVVLDSILNRITQNRAKGKNTFIFIDEIYLLFQHEYSANFLFTLWKRVRKYGAYATGITQNVDDLLQSHTARTMLANSEFIVMLNQASTDRLELAKLLNISDTQLSYITNVDAGHGLIKVGSSLVPFANKFPKNTKLYKLMTTKPGEGA